jgi:hypothetical protein
MENKDIEVLKIMRKIMINPIPFLDFLEVQDNNDKK